MRVGQPVYHAGRPARVPWWVCQPVNHGGYASLLTMVGMPASVPWWVCRPVYHAGYVPPYTTRVCTSLYTPGYTPLLLYMDWVYTVYYLLCRGVWRRPWALTS